MAGLIISVSPGFLLLTAVLYFVGGGGAVTAFLSAALAHELGHLTAMWLAGARIRGLRLTPCGPVLEYSGLCTTRQEMGVIAAGPAAGLVFALVCLHVGTAYFSYAGAIALLATIFNLLPVVPMDGGRLLQHLLEETMPEKTAAGIMGIVGNICAMGVILTGIGIGSVAVAAVGIWMAVLANVPQLR